MKIILVGFVVATCAIQSTLAASVRHGHAPDMTLGTEPQSILEEESSEFLTIIHDILFGDLQDPTESHRSLQDGPNCGALDFPCTHGAVCKADETKGGADWCFCDVANGYINDPGPDIPVIALYGLHGYRSCVQADECSQMATVCALGDEGGGCEDRDPENGKYMCFCKAGYLADTTSIGDHGPEACDQVNECLIFENICGDRKVCIDTPGSFECQCEDGLIETQNGDCLDPPIAETLTFCDPIRGDNCVEPERECDQNLKKCICLPGFCQIGGAGGQCEQYNECIGQKDMACDRRGRGGPNPRSKCIDRSALDWNGNPRQGYTCECLPPYYDAPNVIRGTNCLEPDPTAAPVSAIIATPVPEPASAEPTPPGPSLPCTTFVCAAPFSFCAAEQNRCVCQSGYIQSLGSPFACEEMCFADTDCLADEYCFESRCTACPVGAFREVDSVDGCVDPCISTTMGVPDPCPALCESSSSTEFTCLCEGTDLDCLRDDKCNTGTGTCEDCPAEMPYRNELSADGCIDPCNPSDPDPAPCRAQCEATSATTVTCVCLSDSDCLQDTECITDACQDCPDGFFRVEDSTVGCVNPCQPSSGEPPCPSTCVSSSPTAFTCECPNDLATECPPNDTCTGGTCGDCPTSTPFRPVGQAQCVECIASTDCELNSECNGGICEDCPISTPLRPLGQTQCVECIAITDCDANSECNDGTCEACDASTPLRPMGQAQCVQCIANTDCDADFECNSEVCEACPTGSIREATSVTGCVPEVTCDPPLCNSCDPTSGTPCGSGTFNHPIPDNSDTSSDFVVSSSACVITDVDAFVNIEHTCVGDLDISLTHVDTGTTVILWGDDTQNTFQVPCGCTDNFQITFDDNGGDVPLSNCGDNLSGSFKPIIETFSSVSNPSLSDFNGENAVGVWTLRIVDEIGSDSGRVVSWSLLFACK